MTPRTLRSGAFQGGAGHDPGLGHLSSVHGGSLGAALRQLRDGRGPRGSRRQRRAGAQAEGGARPRRTGPLGSAGVPSSELRAGGLFSARSEDMSLRSREQHRASHSFRGAGRVHQQSMRVADGLPDAALPSRCHLARRLCQVLAVKA